MEGALPVHSRLVQHPLLRRQSGEGKEINELRLEPLSFEFNVQPLFFFAPRPKRQSHDKHHQPKATINCAGYKVLTSIDSYLELINSSLPGREGDLWEGQLWVLFY